MKSIEDLLKNLARPEVLEFGLVTNRLPSVNIGGKFEPVDDEAPSTELLYAMLSVFGGEPHIKALGDKPIQWTHRVEGIGVVAVAAILRKDVIQARFTLAKRDPRSVPPGVAEPPIGQSPEPRPIERSSQPPEATSPFRTRQQGPGPSAPVPSPPPRAASAPPAQRAYEVEDDDGPTAQTWSPPVKGRPGQLATDDVPSTIAAPSGPAKRTETEGVSGNTDPLPAPPIRGLNVEINPPRATGQVSSAIPATEPTPEKDRPRVEGAEMIFALGVRASDIHVVTGKPIFVRTTGDLTPRTQAVSAELVERLAREIVPVRLRDVLANEGACDFALDHPQHGRFRVNVSRQRSGIKISLRVVPREVPSFATFGLPETLASIANLTQGIVLITSPLGQGKSSTLAAVLDFLSREKSAHVLSIEDPIEFVHAKKRALFTQREIGVHARSIGSALASAAFDDVDVLVFGELRDTATIRAAIASAETGRLVIATMCAPSAARALERVVDSFAIDELPRARARVATLVRLVTSQRLLPSIDCARLYAAVEILPNTIALANLVRDGKLDQVKTLQQHARGGSMRLDEALAELVAAQKVSSEVAKRACDAPAEFDALVAARKT